VGLFHPTATSGIRASGIFPATQSAGLINRSCPPVVGQVLLPASCLTGARSSGLAFRALLQAAIRCDKQAV
jgi:hypothetical protein